MKVNQTARQKSYREYLRGEHWKALRELALKRDRGVCSCCGGTDRLQVHHLKYRGRPEETLLEDLETLCRGCHRREHGYGPSLMEEKYYEIRNRIRSCDGARPPTVEMWKEFKEMMMVPPHEFELECFAGLMCEYVLAVCSWRDRARPEPRTNVYWWNLARRVRYSILRRRKGDW